MRSKYLYIVFVLALYNFSVNAQEANNWMFGDKVGLNFATEPPTEISSSMYLPTGPCSVSDHKGNLLFYGNADTIKNRYHKPMKGMQYKAPLIPNGDVQAAVVIPFVGDSNRYYHFISGNTCFYSDSKATFNKPRAVGYHIINMQGDSGLGEVEQQYTQLVPYNCDRITACKHANGKDYWVITHSADKYLAIPVTEIGVGSPVISKMEEFHYGYSNAMVMSHDSRSLYSNVNADYYHCTENKNLTALFKYDFDPATGIFSNQEIVDSSDFEKYPDSLFAFDGIAISPNDSIIYINVKNSRHDYQVNQYLRFKNKNHLYEKYIINIPSWDMACGIGLAPNGKLYSQVGSSAFKVLRILDRPDIFGSQVKNYKSTFTLTNPNSLWSGFEFPNLFFEYKRVQFDVTNMECGGKIYIENKSDTQHFTSMTIYWGDGDSIVQSKGKNFTRNHDHIYTKPGIYFIRVMGLVEGGNKVWGSDSILVSPKLYKPKASFTTQKEIGCLYQKYHFIDGCRSGDTIGGYNWYWNFGDGTKDTILYKNKGKGSISHLYTKSGYYTAQLIFFNGMCSDTFTNPQQIYIAPAPRPGFTVSPSWGCVPQQVYIKPTFNDTIVWEKYYIYNDSNILKYSYASKPSSSPSAKGYNFNHKDSGIYKVKISLEGNTGCVTQDSQYIQFDTRPVMHTINDTFICSGEQLQLTSATGLYKYFWNTGDTTANITVDKGNYYAVKVTHGYCSVSHSIHITEDFNESCKFKVNIYPNPFSQQFNISIYSRTEQNIQIQLYDISGKQVKSYNNVPVNQFSTLQLRYDDFASGMYILHLTSQEKKYIYKIVKMED